MWNLFKRHKKDKNITSFRKWGRKISVERINDKSFKMIYEDMIYEVLIFNNIETDIDKNMNKMMVYYSDYSNNIWEFPFINVKHAMNLMAMRMIVEKEKREKPEEIKKELDRFFK